jgi:hypothetical protein
MPFDQSVITDVSPPVYSAGQITLTWSSSAPAGTWYQIYLAGRLAWSGQARSASLPAPDGRVRVDIGAVAASERDTDFSASLTGRPLDRATLSWLGGTYLDETGGDDVQSFRIFGEHTPGGGIDPSRPLADVAAYPDGVLTDGWGLGGWNQGGWGRAASTYSWSSGPLSSGVWSFAVAPIDRAGNLGNAITGSVTIVAPPEPPARDAAGRRLTYTYDESTGIVTLHWLASPSAPRAGTLDSGVFYSVDLLGLI